YIPHKALLYKRQHTDSKKEKENEYDSLWVYDIETGDKSNLYTSRGSIQSALFSPDNEHISFIESGEDSYDIYMASMSDEIAYKITPVNDLHPKLMRWSDGNRLYFMNVDDTKAILFEYNMDKKEATRKFYIDKAVEDFDVKD